MTPRLTSEMLVGALVRRANDQGGFATILRKGDATSGVIILVCQDRGTDAGLFERVPDYATGRYHLIACGPQNTGESLDRTAYLDRRAKSDPDLWIVELDIVQAERFAAETICDG